ncbi:MAG: NAD(P)H-hydrate dehydratase [Terracidiphilus sp.]|nr:NAD(P)H-hydrate dehydratase [Terracidiphilus sp.]
MHVLTAAEMQACDRATTERFGVASIDLMRAAAGAVAAFARAQFPRARRVTVLCGRGNNGGDGMMAARLLGQAGPAGAGLDVTTLLLGAPEGFSTDVVTAWGELLAAAAPGSVHVVETAEQLAAHAEALKADLIVDGVVGTGFKPPLKGLALAAWEWVKGSGAQVLAVDLPSGWGADATAASAAGSVLQPANKDLSAGAPVFPADAVITFTAPKPAHVFGQLTRRWDQPVVVTPIGSPEEAIVSKLGVDWAGSALDLVRTPRAWGANKGSFGHVLVVGGTFGAAGGRAGAPTMAALAALRSGAGLVTAAVPAPALAVVAAVAPELMTWPLAATAAGAISAESLTPEALTALLAGKTVLAIGPGIGQAAETVKFVTGLLAATKIPAVIDADALNILAAKPVLLAKLARRGERTMVLTPHPGEMARLAGITVAEVQANRLKVARGFAEKFGVTLVLKGARTLIAHPDGRVAVNTTGNPGMAKGGSGDLLTGLVAGLLAQFSADAARAVEAAVCLHGLAADLAVRGPEANQDEHTLLATDSLRQFSRAFRFDSRGENGYVWLQGALHRAAPDEVRG